MTYAKITSEDGNSFHTGFNGDIADLNTYYLGKYFNFGDTEEHPADKMVKAVKVELLDDEGELRKHLETFPNTRIPSATEEDCYLIACSFNRHGFDKALDNHTSRYGTTMLLMLAGF